MGGAEETEVRLAGRLAELRAERSWSLEELAGRTGISRSTLSRLERGEISPTAALLGKLATAYGRTVSRLFAEAESAPREVVRRDEQAVWSADTDGFVRRLVSPPHAGLRGEVIEAELRCGADIAYDEPPVPGLEQHIWVLEGELDVTANGQAHRLSPGDCLRFRLWGPSRFRSSGTASARYVLVVVLP